MEKESVHDVAIVGYGPVGATLSLLLAQQGVDVVVIEREESIFSIPRGAHLDDEVMRIFQAMGMPDELAPTFEPPVAYEYFDADWNKFMELKFRPGLSDQGWRYDYMFFQPDFEDRVRGRVDRSGKVSTLLGCEVTDIVQDETGATVRFRDVSEREQDEIDRSGDVKARYVVGCDGAGSKVRKLMGSSFEELGLSQQWLVVDVRLEGDADPGRKMFTWCHPKRAVTYVPLVGPTRRFEFKLKPGENREELEQPERVWDLLSPWLKPGDATVLRQDVYHFHSLLARRWRADRLFIAGDAAHLMSPKLGQGLCSGFRDAINLAWKLARVVHGRSPEALLDTYESERSPNARTFIEVSHHMAESIAALEDGLVRPPGETVEEIVTPRPPLGPGLHGDAPSPAGELSEQPTLSDGLRLDDRVGYRFALLADSALVDALGSETAENLSAIDTEVVTDTEGELVDYLSRADASAILIRPDRYVAGVAASAAELDALVADLAPLLRGEHLPPGTSVEPTPSSASGTVVPPADASDALRRGGVPTN